MIENFVSSRIAKGTKVSIHFKGRETIRGVFIHTDDYQELKAKNFWRVVHQMHEKEWKATSDQNLARVFNGAAFTRLTEEKI